MSLRLMWFFLPESLLRSLHTKSLHYFMITRHFRKRRTRMYLHTKNYYNSYFHLANLNLHNVFEEIRVCIYFLMVWRSMNKTSRSVTMSTWFSLPFIDSTGHRCSERYFIQLSTHNAFFLLLLNVIFKKYHS